MFRVVVLVSLFSVSDVLFVYLQAVTLKPGKKPKSGLLELLCVEVSPAGRVLLLSSGFSALSLNQGVYLFFSLCLSSHLLSSLPIHFGFYPVSEFLLLFFSNSICLCCVFDLSIYFYMSVSHVGARVQIMLGEPVRDDAALLKWSGRTFPNWTEQQRYSAVQTLNGNFGDYKTVSNIQVQNQLPFSGTTAHALALLISTSSYFP